MSSTISGFITADYEGISRVFTEISPLPAKGYCDLFKAKRYGRWFLLKCLKLQYINDPAYQQLLRKEMEVLMALQHHAIMQVYGIEEVQLAIDDKRTCLIAEWIDGITLAEFLRTRKEQAQESGTKSFTFRPSPFTSTCRRIADELVDAVAYIHQQQVVHRDLKPSNIMVTRNGCNVKIIDFGLADTDSHAILKQPAGTLRYMAPEQANTAIADTRNDIYSLGIILQELQLGRTAYRRIINKCLKPIDSRYSNAEALKKDMAKAEQSTWGIVFIVILALIALVAIFLFVRGLRQRAQRLEQEAAQMTIRMKILNHELIDFEDPYVAQLCVRYWDTDHDGFLSPREAQAVTTLGHVFTNDSLVTSFNELKHFTGLTEISPRAFRDCHNLETVTLPNTIRFIRKEAFRNTALTSFTFPATVTAVGDNILDDCPVLETVIFESVPPNINEGSKHLQNCPRLTTIFIPQHAFHKRITGHSWEEVEHLMTDHVLFQDPAVEDICLNHWDINRDRKLSISEAQAVTELGTAFTRDPLIQRFPELRFFTGLQTIDISAFDECVNLETISLPVTIKTVGDRAFAGCLKLENIELPQHLEKIGNHALASTGLRSIYLPASVGEIGLHVFTACQRLTSVSVSPNNPVYDSRDNCNAIIHTATNTMIGGGITATVPASVTDFSDEALVGNSRESFTIPPQIHHIGHWSLNFFRVRYIYCQSPIPPAYDSQKGSNVIFYFHHLAPGPIIHVPYGSLDAYRQAEGWDYYAQTIIEYPSISVPTPIVPLALAMRNFPQPTWQGVSK